MSKVGYHPIVELVTYTPDPEKIVSAAAKLCYASDESKIFSGDPSKFVTRLMDMGHMSPLEHISFTFYIQGVSRALLAQITRHRIGTSFSVRSQRYVDHDKFDYIIPSELVGKWVKTPDDGDHEFMDAVQYYKHTMDYINKSYNALNEALGNTGEKSNEIARYVLPNATETKMFVTMNARQLIHFSGERQCVRAQSEIRHLAKDMLNKVKEVCPTIFNNVGPKCEQLGHCPEGTKYCGRIITNKGDIK